MKNVIAGSKLDELRELFVVCMKIINHSPVILCLLWTNQMLEIRLYNVLT
jgi:hypothetical protein